MSVAGFVFWMLSLGVACMAAALWHGQQMWRLGEKHGRQLDARHARERLLFEAQKEATLGALKSEQDVRLVRRWAIEAFRRARP